MSVKRALIAVLLCCSLVLPTSASVSSQLSSIAAHPCSYSLFLCGAGGALTPFGRSSLFLSVHFVPGEVGVLSFSIRAAAPGLPGPRAGPRGGSWLQARAASQQAPTASRCWAALRPDSSSCRRPRYHTLPSPPICCPTPPEGGDGGQTPPRSGPNQPSTGRRTSVTMVPLVGDVSTG